MRADQLLVQRGLAASRSQAARLIDGGARWLSRDGWKPLYKSDNLFEDAQIELDDASEARYVSRGGLKLEGALRHTGIDPTGLQCLDVGQSTGGFTDCLLQHGALAVLGLDVGHAQLHPRLREDPRVTCLEGINAREPLATAMERAASSAAGIDWDAPMSARTITKLDRAGRKVQVADDSKLIAINDRGSWTSGQNEGQNLDFEPPGIELMVLDLSFISQTLVLPAVSELLVAGARVLALVKPQFELQANQLAKGGLVKDPTLYPIVEARIRASYADCGLTVHDYFESAIAGGDGNREFFIHASKLAL